MSRDSVLRGNVIVLTAVFYNAIGEFADPSSISFSIYPPGYNPELDGVTTADAWVYNVTLTSGGSGPLADPAITVEQASTGHYSYSFTVPEDADLGSGYDRWEAVLDSEDLDDTFNFVIVGGGSVGTTVLYENNIVYVKLSKDILAEDGTSLASDETYYFTTTYNPLYVSSRQVYLYLGAVGVDVPEDLINLAIYEAGRELEANLFNSSGSNVAYFNFLKEEFVRTLATITIVGAMMGNPGTSSRLSKSLGDLSVSRGGNGEILQELYFKYSDELKRLLTAIRSGGVITPEGSIGPQISVKGAWAEDRFFVGRLWEPTNRLGNSGRSAANSSKYRTLRRNKRTYIPKRNKGGS